MRALFDIAFFNEGRPTQVKDIAERQAIPLRFLEQIFQDLKRAGIVASKRGPQGGYSLARPAQEIPLGEVVAVIEGPVTLSEAAAVAKVEGPTAGRALRRSEGTAADGQKVTDAVFDRLSAQIEGCLNAVSLADICAQAESLGVRRPGEGGCQYFI